MLLLPLLALLAPPAEIQSLLDRAAALPPELHCDLILRVLDADKIDESKLAWELTVDAFNLSQQARVPYPVWFGSGVPTFTDSTAGMQVMAAELKLDKLSLTERVLDRMLSANSKEAKERFLAFTLPNPPPPTCADTTVPVYNPYFRLLFQVVDQGFSPEEVRNGRPLALASATLASLSSTEQIMAAAEALSNAPLTARDRAELATALATSLARVRTTWRSFGRLDELTRPLAQLAHKLMDGGESANELGRALSSYIGRHVNEPRCAEAARPQALESLKKGLQTFNDFFLAQLKIDGLKAVRLEELQPPPLEGPSRDYEFWTSETSKAFMARYKDLRFGKDEKEKEEPEKRSTEWQSAMRVFLNDVERWQPKPPLTPAAWFHERMLMARALLDILPEGSLREEEWDNSLRFLRDSPMLRESPGEWLVHARGFLKQRDAATAIPRAGDANLQLIQDADRLLGPRKK